MKILNYGDYLFEFAKLSDIVKLKTDELHTR